MTAAELLARLPQMEEEAQEHERRARLLRQIIVSVRALNGHAAEIRTLESWSRTARSSVDRRPTHTARGDGMRLCG